MLGVYTILGVAEEGWGSSRTLALRAVSVGLIAAFVAPSGARCNPLKALRLFRSRNVAGANLIQALLVARMFGMYFGLVHVQQILGYDALEVG